MNYATVMLLPDYHQVISILESFSQNHGTITSIFSIPFLMLNIIFLSPSLGFGISSTNTSINSILPVDGEDLSKIRMKPLQIF